MGYYTHYQLEIKGPELPIEEEIIADLRAQFDDAEVALEPDGSSQQSNKWYDHEQNLAEFSKKYPDFVFILYGKGEENEDMWVKYFKNGEVQIADAIVTLEEFDENKLQDPSTV